MFEPEVFQRLRWCSLDPIQSAETMGYRYLVTEGVVSHVAFRKRTSFRRWLAERELRIAEGQIPAEGVFGRGKIHGAYAKRSWMNKDAFVNLVCVREILVMDNANYVLGKVTREQIEGQRMCVVNYLNVNTNPLTFDYEDGESLYG